MIYSCGASTSAEISGDGAASVYGDFVETMFDFDTRNHDFQVRILSNFLYYL